MELILILLFLFIGLPLIGSLVVFVLGSGLAIVTAVTSWFTRKD